MCSANATDKLPPFLIVKYKSMCCSTNVARLYTKYELNRNFWMTIKIFEDYLAQINRNSVIKLQNIALYPSACCLSVEHHIFQQHQTCNSSSGKHKPTTTFKFWKHPCSHVPFLKTVHSKETE
jgi:hypothetical protein